MAKKQPKVDMSVWVDSFLDFAASEPCPKDWADAAVYHLKNATNDKVGKVKVQKWEPLGVDPEQRIIDQAEVHLLAEVKNVVKKVVVNMTNSQTVVSIS